MSRLTSSPSRGWGGAMPMRQVGRNCAAKPREHATLAPLHIFWRCRSSLLTCRKGSRSLASLARNSKKITYNDRARATTHHSGKVTRTRSEYLLAMPLLPTYLQEGLAELGLSCEEFEKDNL